MASHGDGVTADGVNPFKVHGEVYNLQPSDLPKNAVLHWKLDTDGGKVASESVALPQAGLNGACKGWPGAIAAPSQQVTSTFTSTFTGAGGARARYRVVQYAYTDQAVDAIRGLGQALHACGLTEQQGGSYSGRANGNGQWLDVSVRQWKTWVGVTEAQYSPTS